MAFGISGARSANGELRSFSIVEPGTPVGKTGTQPPQARQAVWSRHQHDPAQRSKRPPEGARSANVRDPSWACASRWHLVGSEASDELSKPDRSQVLGHDNYFTIGASVDRSKIGFQGNSELGYIFAAGRPMARDPRAPAARAARRPARQ